MTEKKKIGRPRVLPIPPEGQAQKQGLAADNARATFIVSERLWKRLREYQVTSPYKSNKDLMNDMITKFLEEKGVDIDV